MKIKASNQLTLDFEPSVRQRFATLRECLHFTVLEDRRGIKAVASDVDVSTSELSRRLAPTEGDPRSLDVNLMVAIMHSTQNLLPLQWLLGEFTRDEATRQAAAISAVENLLPQLTYALHELKRSKAKPLA